jgi:tRNA(fMet)-specific endonuclease VapC
MLYLLDTNIISFAMKGSAAVDARLSQLDPADWAISAISHAEICYGLALRPQATQLAALAQAFLDASTTLPWDALAAERHGALRAHLRLSGTPIGDFDEMIAAHALALGAVLVTNNTRHFDRVPGLLSEDWVTA